MLFSSVAALAATPIPGSRRVLFFCLLGMLIAMYAGARRGYWSGPLRQIAPTVALMIALFGAWLTGASFGHWLLQGSVVPWLLRGVCGILLLGCVLWLAAFGLLWRLGRNRFPNPTGESEHPVLGAVVGCWTAMLWSVAGFLLLAAAGAIAQFWLDNTRSSRSGLGQQALVQLVRIKNSLALVNGAAWLETWNPLPDHTRRTLEKGMRVLNTPGALFRLQNLEPIRSIATHPAFYPLTQDPEIRALVSRRDMEKLLAHPAVLHLLANDDFQKTLAAANLEQLFDAALQSTASPASTTPPAK